MTILFQRAPGLLARGLAMVALLAAAAGGSPGDIISDGNMDNLTVGTNPDNGQPAGAWGFPQNYIDGGLGEIDVNQLTVVETSSFDPNRPGNSMKLDSSRDTGFTHLPNLFNEVVQEAPDQIVRVTFEIYVPGPSGGGAVYVGGDHGGGGFNNATDRGPQIVWRSDHTIVYSPGNVVVVEDYPFETWQRVQFDIDLVADRYDMYWAAGDDPLELVGDDLPYRSGTQQFLDRFTYVHFSDLEFPASSYLDNVAVEVIEAKNCQYRMTRDSKAKGGCETCPVRDNVIETADACQAAEDCPKKLRGTMACPDGPGECKKIKGKRVGCG